MRRTLMSVAVAFAGTAGVIAAGWSLQAAALPPPKPAARIAADASVWFHDYGLAVDVFHFDHRRSEGACVRSRSLQRGGRSVKASLLSFEGGPILRISGAHHVSVVARRRRGSPPGLLAAEAGCSRLLLRTLAAFAQGGGHLTTERAYAANRPAIALELHRGREGRMTLYVSPRTDRPLVAFVVRDRRHITARIYLQRIRRHVLRRFEILDKVKPEPKR